MHNSGFASCMILQKIRYTPSEKTAEYLSNPLCTVIQMCRFVFCDLFRNKILDRLGGGFAGSSFGHCKSGGAMLAIRSCPAEQGTFSDSEMFGHLIGRIAVFEVKFDGFEFVGRRIVDVPIRPVWGCFIHRTPFSFEKRVTIFSKKSSHFPAA